MYHGCVTAMNMGQDKMVDMVGCMIQDNMEPRSAASNCATQHGYVCMMYVWVCMYDGRHGGLYDPGQHGAQDCYQQLCNSTRACMYDVCKCM